MATFFLNKLIDWNIYSSVRERHCWPYARSRFDTSLTCNLFTVESHYNLRLTDAFFGLPVRWSIKYLMLFASESKLSNAFTFHTNQHILLKQSRNKRLKMNWFYFVLWIWFRSSIHHVHWKLLINLNWKSRIIYLFIFFHWADMDATFIHLPLFICFKVKFTNCGCCKLIWITLKKKLLMLLICAKIAILWHLN